MDYYSIPTNMHGVLNLKESIYTNEGEQDIELEFLVDGEAFAIKLDTDMNLKNNSKKSSSKKEYHPLFHFLNDQGQPWSRRCDFVIFHLFKNRLKVYCFEFKYKSLPTDSVVSQLKSSEFWCKSLHSTIKIYTNHKKMLKLSKFALTYCDEQKVATYLDQDNKYLAKDPSIRHYHYDQIDGMELHKLDHESEISIS